MSYAELYEAVQTKQPKISTRWLRDQVISLTHITSVKEQWSGLMDGKYLRGFWIEGPMGPPVPLDENEALIGLARNRGMDKPWRRFVYTKELMHAFDEPEEKADSIEKFEIQAQRFKDPTKESSAMYRAEGKAFWRALGVLCPESFRLESKEKMEKSEISESAIAARLKIPPVRVRELMRDEFLDIIAHLKA